MVDSMIIGIHGLCNKPPHEDLERWWAAAITEGLQRNHQMSVQPAFALAYWADIRNKTPIPTAEFEEPYAAADGQGPFERCTIGLLDKARAVGQKWLGNWLDIEKQLFGLGTNIESLLGIKFDDLADYYDQAEIRQKMRSRLSELLAEHQGKRLMLIAHSMGSIIAYDVLRSCENSAAIKIEHFITVGSPIGLPIVAHKIRQEFGEKHTPQQVQRWTNIADPGDKVALDCNLADEYGPNHQGVRVSDVLVHNGYVNPEGESNPHNICGYLRTPEASDCIREFLMSGL